MRILVLGGTTEASGLVAGLARMPEHETTLSLAGRTSAPRAAPVPTRIGGFGGPEGLATWLGEHRIDLLVDATHPFAARISDNAAQAAGASGVQLLAVRRPAWTRDAGDSWIEVASVEAAGEAVRRAPSLPPLAEGREGVIQTLRVLVTIGRQELAAFLAAAPRGNTYLVRAIEPIGHVAPPGAEVVEIRDRGPFSLDSELALIREQRIDVLVTKNSGGAATAPKIEAARVLGLPVVIVRQPDKPIVAATIATSGEALAWIAAHQASLPTKRGV